MAYIDYKYYSEQYVGSLSTRRLSRAICGVRRRLSTV